MKQIALKYLTTTDVLNFLAAAELISYRLDANSVLLPCNAEPKFILIAKVFNMEVFLKSELP